MGALWYVGQTGIVLEIIGAASVVVWAAQATRAAKAVHKTPTGEVSAKGLDEFAEWLIADTRALRSRQAWAFGLIAAGLVMQFAGNFASR